MHRSHSALAVSCVLVLAGCSAADSTPPPDSGQVSVAPSAEDVAALAAVEVAGSPGEMPTLTFGVPFAVSAPVARVVDAGTGDVIEDGALVGLDYVLVDGASGDVLGSTWQDLGAPQPFLVGDSYAPGALKEILVGGLVGMRFLLAVPPEAATEEVEALSTTVFAFEVVEVKPGRAEGQAIEPPPELPEVTLMPDGAPTVAVPLQLQEPTDLVAQTLIAGPGAAVELGDRVTVRHTGWLWDGTLVDSSWETGTTLEVIIGVGDVIDGWDKGLLGQTVGSQVLLLVPSDFAYGDDGLGYIPGGATLVFVVDIIDVK